MLLNISFAKWRPFCLDLNVLINATPCLPHYKTWVGFEGTSAGFDSLSSHSCPTVANVKIRTNNSRNGAFCGIERGLEIQAGWRKPCIIRLKSLCTHDGCSVLQLRHMRFEASQILGDAAFFNFQTIKWTKKTSKFGITGLSCILLNEMVYESG